MLVSNSTAQHQSKNRGALRAGAKKGGRMQCPRSKSAAPDAEIDLNGEPRRGS